MSRDCLICRGQEKERRSPLPPRSCESPKLNPYKGQPNSMSQDLIEFTSNGMHYDVFINSEFAGETNFDEDAFGNPWSATINGKSFGNFNSYMQAGRAILRQWQQGNKPLPKQIKVFEVEPVSKTETKTAAELMEGDRLSIQGVVFEIRQKTKYLPSSPDRYRLMLLPVGYRYTPYKGANSDWQDSQEHLDKEHQKLNSVVKWITASSDEKFIVDVQGSVKPKAVPRGIMATAIALTLIVNISGAIAATPKKTQKPHQQRTVVIQPPVSPDK